MLDNFIHEKDGLIDLFSQVCNTDSVLVHGALNRKVMQ